MICMCLCALICSILTYIYLLEQRVSLNQFQIIINNSLLLKILELKKTKAHLTEQINS